MKFTLADVMHASAGIGGLFGLVSIGELANSCPHAAVARAITYPLLIWVGGCSLAVILGALQGRYRGGNLQSGPLRRPGAIERGSK